MTQKWRLLTQAQKVLRSNYESVEKDEKILGYVKILEQNRYHLENYV